MEDIHAFAREEDDNNLIKCIESGVRVDLKDSEGQTPLHWAVDRGHLNTTKVLLSKNANVNEKDSEGQGPLHYAAVCERKDIAQLLVKNNADIVHRALPDEIYEMDTESQKLKPQLRFNNSQHLTVGGCK
ncbi:unnamed protein product [Cuscuta epithymum]|uniref:Uncharacterized protein n=1 Tax=Cuscuta epithymum TaxID=186058 RepID=A0AAV0EI88_9ASTE|nr:unnamed protein product [Cuscuta epithymum]